MREDTLLMKQQVLPKNSQNKDKLLKIKKYGNWNFKKLQWGKGWKIHLIESRMKRQKTKQERKNRNNKMKRRKLKHKSCMDIKHPLSVKKIEKFLNPVRKSSHYHETAEY